MHWEKKVKKIIISGKSVSYFFNSFSSTFFKLCISANVSLLSKYLFFWEIPLFLGKQYTFQNKLTANDFLSFLEAKPSLSHQKLLDRNYWRIWQQKDSKSGNNWNVEVDALLQQHHGQTFLPFSVFFIEVGVQFKFYMGIVFALRVIINIVYKWFEQKLRFQKTNISCHCAKSNKMWVFSDP